MNLLYRLEEELTYGKITSLLNRVHDILVSYEYKLAEIGYGRVVFLNYGDKTKGFRAIIRVEETSPYTAKIIVETDDKIIADELSAVWVR